MVLSARDMKWYRGAVVRGWLLVCFVREKESYRGVVV
jgi:hypothetical protein